MAQFSLHPGLRGAGYLLNVQSDVLDVLATRQVIPLLPAEDVPPVLPQLNPVFDIEGQPHVLVTQYQAAIATRLLQPPVGSLEDHRQEIVAAMDFMLQGY